MGAGSETRQVECARAYAAQHGWTVSDAHIFVDDGVSGAEFKTRPGFVRLMNALTPRAPFDGLVVSELSQFLEPSTATPRMASLRYKDHHKYLFVNGVSGLG